ncbi:hypothetical protein GYMLUDRAFT_178677 [Collybiopsis luxurians FD-317 M1]|uniref:CxC1-like cysteine cluster associated with KDZ transposases domain-containing protein n=1 Tax=Collybiopsis luxurians FD-317 M1 TaxID=944289 RepID=A0A0D0BVF6_9AGAR|nr:hypothetical protein GYMLUDRAFT_178677 [Collybiopsis luxurians FD-317 M1]
MHKRFTQAQHWRTEVIPRILRPYMDILAHTNNLRDEPVAVDCNCTCLTAASIKSIIVVRFYRLERITLETCACRPVPDQLVARGLFPCAPIDPSLAVEMRILEFVSLLFLRVSPNNTAWCGALEEFLQKQGYHMMGKVSYN